MKISKQGGKKNRKIGRGMAKGQHYRLMHTREKNKIKRILQSSGVDAATKYAQENNLSAYLRGLMD
jgi:hypothetical protein